MDTLTITHQNYDNHDNQAWALSWNGLYYQYDGKEWVLFPHTSTVVGNTEPLGMVQNG